MKKALIKAVVVAAFAAGASGAYAQATVAVLNNVNQNQNASNVYQFMDLGSVITPFGGGAGAIGRAFSNGTINQTQNGLAGRQELYLGTVVATPISGAQSTARANNINQTQNGLFNLQRMAIGSVGINPVTGAAVPHATGNTNVNIVGTVTQTQSAAVVGTPQYMSIGAIW